MTRTGMAPGRVRPIIYFQNASGYVILAPEQVGEGTALARKMYEERYKHQGWMWCETDGSFADAQRLEKRLQDQAMNEARNMRDRSMEAYDAAKSKIARDLRQRMASSDCSQWERDFIELWLQLAPEKRAKYEQRFMERQSYLWALQQDSGTKVDDRMPSQPGEFWRNEAQQKA